MAELPTITFAPLTEQPQSKVLVHFLADNEERPSKIAQWDQRTSDAVSRAIDVSSFKPKRKSVLDILGPQGVEASRLLFIGLGDASNLTERDWMELGGVLRGKLTGKSISADVVFDLGDEASASSVSSFSLGFCLRNYSFRKYKSKKNKESKDESESSSDFVETVKLTLFCSKPEQETEAWRLRQGLANGVYFARDLVNEPANILTPPEFAARLSGLRSLGLEVEVLDEIALKSLGMTALLAVGQGSLQPSSAVIMKWQGNPASKADGNLVFIGKGVCFDTGGISIKPAAGMEDMKGDMGGAAAVAGLMMALAEKQAPVNAVGLVGLVENMPSGTAQRPGDIINSASGQTIEVLNTDAEGRLVLADLLWYAQEHLSPKSMITLATLTGAIIVSLGKENAGLFSNSDNLAAQLSEAGESSGETVWRLPLSKKYNKQLDSKIADMKNIGGRDAGSITAAQFLQRFVNDGVSWAHLDIAGTAMASPSTDINHSWGSGYGVRLLDRFIENLKA